MRVVSPCRDGDVWSINGEQAELAMNCEVALYSGRPSTSRLRCERGSVCVVHPAAFQIRLRLVQQHTFPSPFGSRSSPFGLPACRRNETIHRFELVFCSPRTRMGTGGVIWCRCLCTTRPTRAMGFGRWARTSASSLRYHRANRQRMCRYLLPRYCDVQ